MLRFLYRWRYRRAQNAESFQVPSDSRGRGNGQVHLGSYLSQESVRGRSFDRFDLPRRSRRWLLVMLAILIFSVTIWIVIESVAALELFRN